MKWVSLFLIELFLIGYQVNISQAIKYIPPGECGCSGNGDSSNPVPFYYGDLVISKAHPEHGIHMVTNVEKVIKANGKTSWKITAIYGPAGRQLSTYTADMTDFTLFH